MQGEKKILIVRNSKGQTIKETLPENYKKKQKNIVIKSTTTKNYNMQLKLPHKEVSQENHISKQMKQHRMLDKARLTIYLLSIIDFKCLLWISSNKRVVNVSSMNATTTSIILS